MNKIALRKIFLDKQKALSNDQIKKTSLELCELFFDQFSLDPIRVLHLFLTIDQKNEIDTSGFINELWDSFINIKTVVPRVNWDRDVLEHLAFNSASTLAVNRWGIPEPIGDELVDETKIDLVLVPLLCFDKRGFRVGHGKGYYDKFLSLCRTDCLKIGLSFFEPVEEIGDVENHDVKLDFCITPKKIVDFK